MEPWRLTIAERLARARADLAQGLPVGVGTGGAWWLALAAEGARGPRLTALLEGGAAVLAITAERAATLRARAYDGDLARLPLAAGTREAEIAAIADPARDLDTPLKGPFAALREGDAAPARAALALAKAAQRLPAAVLAPVAAPPPEITALDLAALPTETPPPGMRRVVGARLPMALAGAGRLTVYRPGDGGDEHYTVEVGHPSGDAPVLVRLHSACFTGDVLGSLKCDCGPQLHAALRQMAEAGGGLLLYLNQEGRGIGLANKMRAYALQDQGFDTVEANHRLGFLDDERDFRAGAEMLRDRGIDRVRLLTNNPRKVAMLERCGIQVVERVPLWVGATDENRAYLRTKAEKSGHLR
ncbi:GTP cyclohydrolase II [Rhodobacteraceae bacterium CCMM004]|nr:GTP cyclohydrolase II [Rhodobacteraceae bacterium CCMM004]